MPYPDILMNASTTLPLVRSLVRMGGATLRATRRRGPATAAVVVALATLLVGIAQSAAALPERDLVVVVGEGAAVESMSVREVRKLFLGKVHRLPDGSRAVLARFEPADAAFNRRVLLRSDAQVTAAWSRLRFSGRVRTPLTFDSVEEVAKFVASTPSAVAYLDAGEALPEGLRAVFVASR